MPGNELRLIGRYFGGSCGRFLIAGQELSGSASDAGFDTGSTSGPDRHAQLHHHHVVQPPKKPLKHQASDEELMQMLFAKMESTPFHGPLPPTDPQQQPGH